MKVTLTMPSLDSFFWQVAQISLQSRQPILLITKDTRELEEAVQKINFFAPELKILEFPDWEILIYDRLSPSRSQIIKRLTTLTQLQQSSVKIVATTLHAYLQRLMPVEYIESYVFQCHKKDKLDIKRLGEKLVRAGYQRVSQVSVSGEFCVRGSTVDVFPLNSIWPFRIDIHIDEIEQLWYFDPSTQKTKIPCEKIELIPTREFPLSKESIVKFKGAWKQKFGEPSSISSLYKQLSSASYPAGIEYYLPLFFDHTNTLFDYLPKNTQWISSFHLPSAISNVWEQFELRYDQFNADKNWPILPIEQLYQTSEECMHQLVQLPSIEQEIHKYEKALPISEFLNTTQASSFSDIKTFLTHFQSSATKHVIKIVFCATRSSHYEPLLKMLGTMKYFPVQADNWPSLFQSKRAFQIILSPIEEGFWLEKQKILVISDTLLLQPEETGVAQRRHRSSSELSNVSPLILNDLIRLKLNTSVVHSDYGIGQYSGLELVNVGDHQEEFIVLNYAKSTKLYVPVTDIYKISYYSGQENPPLNSLNTENWKKTKQKAFKQVQDTAAELLDLYAQRSQLKGYCFAPPNQDYEKFVKAFKFEATPDQHQAIESVIEDLCDEKPMDRLICGDVGFGKTEVAMRASFLAVQSNKQVVLLAPTTLLVEQHYRNFQDRFSDWPVKIDWLSRFRSQSDIKKIQAALHQGKIDIIIGTHTLFSKSTQFKDLGLVIIDEEHHFGVQQKEKLKTLRKNVDILTLTATPIPRTLQSGLSGLKEISIIATPPPGRLPIKTFVLSRRSDLMREAILREFLRGGQVYFVHNRIATLETAAREIQILVPEAQIIVAHGQLEESDLEKRMALFYQKHYNILLCTSIIETGLDIPSVNTLIVDRADLFGLAQLHQLRGRVGRARHQAYAYFLIPEKDFITKQARQRLEALASSDYIGSGFNLASQDLDMRGAGEILGEQQSGIIQGIGLTLYMELLHKTIQANQKEGANQNPTLSETTTSLDLQISAFFPQEYIADVTQRLQYYKKMAHSHNIQTLDTLRHEIINRYGVLPDSAQNLFHITKLKLDSKTLGIQKAEVNALGGWIEFCSNTPFDPYKMLQWIQNHSLQFKLKNNSEQAITRLHFKWETALETSQRIQAVQQIFEQLRSLVKLV